MRPRPGSKAQGRQKSQTPRPGQIPVPHQIHQDRARGPAQRRWHWAARGSEAVRRGDGRQPRRLLLRLDLLLIAELPDDAAATARSLNIGAAGALDVAVTVLITPGPSTVLPGSRSLIPRRCQPMAPAHPSPFERGRFPVWTSLSPGNLWYGFPYLHDT